MGVFYLLKKKKRKKDNRHCIFENTCITDVTNFEANSPTDSLGYLSSANISVFSDGMISLVADNEEEYFSIFSIVQYNDNVGNFDPLHVTEVKFILKDKCIVVTFNDKATKKTFTHKLKSLTEMLAK